MKLNLTNDEAADLLAALDEDWLLQEKRCGQRVKEPESWYDRDANCGNPAPYDWGNSHSICAYHAWQMYYESEDTIQDVEEGLWKGGWEDFSSSRTLVRKDGRWLSAPIVMPNESFSWPLLRLLFELKLQLNAAKCFGCRTAPPDSDFDSCAGFCRVCWEAL